MSIEEYTRVVGAVGTCEGRMLEISRTLHHIKVGDPASVNPGWTLNTDQATELAEALLAAVSR